MVKRFIESCKKHPKVLFLLILFVGALIFIRFYNLDHTARFTQDESSDLLRMQQLAHERKITLVGPISNDGDKVFGSLTYYQWLPFVIISNFDPVSPAYGMAFWGVLTALVLFAITWKLNAQYVWLTAVLVLIWTPLVETSRWAWNPHLVTFWIALGVLVYLFKRPWSYFLSGVFMALAFHNHFIALIATSVFVVCVAIQECKAKHWQNAAWIMLGYALPFVPFVLFDLRHPPGLFFSKYISGSRTPNTIHLTSEVVVHRVLGNINLVSGYISGPFFKWLLIGLTAVLIIVERKKLERLIWLLPIAAQVVIGSLFTDLQTRYFLPGLVFYLVWLLLPRKGIPMHIARDIVGICLVASLFTIVPNLTLTKVPPDIYSLRAATNYIAAQITDKQLKNVNVATLASPDSDPLSHIYREALSVKDIGLKAASEYDTSENLFVISTSDASVIEQDESTAMVIFRRNNAHLADVYSIPNSPWKVYWFNY